MFPIPLPTPAPAAPPPSPANALQVLLCVYPLLWFQLYSFLFGQRRKKLSAGSGADKKRQ